MDFKSFFEQQKPVGKTSALAAFGGKMPLLFGEAELLSLLDDYSSFDDLRGDLGIEDSWGDDFPRTFPTFRPLATVDSERLIASGRQPDSYSEFLLLVDTASEAGAVYWFSADWWSWERWESKKNGFKQVAPSFDAFLKSLVDFK